MSWLSRGKEIRATFLGYIPARLLDIRETSAVLEVFHRASHLTRDIPIFSIHAQRRVSIPRDAFSIEAFLVSACTCKALFL